MTENDNKKDQPASPTTPHSQPSNSTSEQRPILEKIRGAFFGGPIPPPDILAGYNEVVPGAADRIITMAETQSRHRQEIEKSIINSDIRNSKLGLWLGFFIAMAAIVSGTISILGGHAVSGTIIGGSGVAGLAAVFVYGSTQRRKEREAKQRMLMERG